MAQTLKNPALKAFAMVITLAGLTMFGTTPAAQAEQPHPLPEIRVPEQLPAGSLGSLTILPGLTAEDVGTTTQFFCQDSAKKMVEIADQWASVSDQLISLAGNPDDHDEYQQLAEEAADLRIAYTNLNAVNWECLTAAGKIGSL